MTRRIASSIASVAVLVVPLLVGLVTAAPAAAQPSANGVSHRAARVCATPAAGDAACQSLVVVDGKGRPVVAATPAGYGPIDLQSAYGLAAAASTAGSGATVAIVAAYDDPTAESDLAAYRAYFGLSACTSTDGCLTKIDQRGGTTYPAANKGWAQEISLDLDMVSAICPNCHILLVEADSASFTDLAVAVDTAAAWTDGTGHHVVAINNSYGGTESAGESSCAAAYDHAGIAITAASGDGGYGVSVPAAYSTVTAVGGTTLTVSRGSGRGWAETAWSGAGSGCSAYVAQPAWQNALPGVTTPQCANRVVADVAAVADPNTGVAVYDTYALGRSAGWLVFGGTSVATPIVAGVYALAGDFASSDSGAEGIYAAYSSDPGALNDVTIGANGSCPATNTAATAATPAGAAVAAAALFAGGAAASPNKGKPGRGGGGGTTAPNTYLCQAQPGYDGPTGLGTPSGVAAF